MVVDCFCLATTQLNKQCHIRRLRRVCLHSYKCKVPRSCYINKSFCNRCSVHILLKEFIISIITSARCVEICIQNTHYMAHIVEKCMSKINVYTINNTTIYELMLVGVLFGICTMEDFWQTLLLAVACHRTHSYTTCTCACHRSSTKQARIGASLVLTH